MKKHWIRIFFLAFLTLFFFAIDYILLYSFDMYKAKKQTHLLEGISPPGTKLSIEDTIDMPTGTVKTERMSQLEILQEENTDIIAWVEIENTNISYPVLQGSDNDFYMDHNYKKEYSMSGSIFLDAHYQWNPPSSNFLLYGHNMKNGTMFQNLLLYASEAYYKEHPRIRFTTNTEDSYYEILSVLKTRIFYRSEQNVFRYYYFINAETEEDYNSFVENAKKESLYDTGVTASYGDQLLTLSTCAYHTEDGRFVLIARKA